MHVTVEQGKKQIQKAGSVSTISVPFTVVHRARRFSGHVAAPVGGCTHQAEIIWENGEPMVSDLGLRTLRSTIVRAALGAANDCRFPSCPEQAAKKLIAL